MLMDLTGIKNQNEYYTNHYFTSIFQENAEETINGWKSLAKDSEVELPWRAFRNTSAQYYRVRDRYQHLRNEEQSKPYVQEMAELYFNALGFKGRNSVETAVGDDLVVPVFHEETKSNGAPLLWAFLCVAGERDEDILESFIFAKGSDEETNGKSVSIKNDDILAKLFFAGEEAPRFIILIGINQIALIDRNKWNEKRFLQFNLDDIFSRHEESTFMAMTVLLHKESLCPSDGTCVLDGLDENSHKHSAGVSDALKYALRECIEILGNEVIYDMKNRQGINLDENPVDAAELTLECLRYMYRFLFMLFIEARPELGYAPMKTQAYVQGYSLEGIRDVCDRVDQMTRESEEVLQGYYIDDTISELFRMIYEGYPGDLDAYKKALEEESLHDVFTIEALKAHIFDPEYTKHITGARLRNCAMLQIVDLMSISRASGRTRAGRISYSALGINQMGAVYEALLSYRGFIAEDTLFEVKRAGDKFNELDVGYFVHENELEQYDDQTERVRYEKGPHKGELRKYEKGTFIYRLAGREREKSASYYTPEVLTKCLVKYALKELLKDKTADEILNLTICEPAMGSAAFLNESINQIAEAYLNKKQEELGETIPFDKRFEELQKVKMFIADRNVYGCDLNPVAVELAEVSLWLNTIYKGAYVPWFGTQLVNGNSLIGARRQVYYTSKLEKGKWFDEAPDRVMPGEKRKRTGVTSRVYHFLLGDPGMANYTDKVIKTLEPDNIKTIKEWQKEFTKKYDEDEIQTLLRLSDVIDTLWDRTIDLRKSVEKATSEPLSVYGHDESQIEGSHKTIREKDEIYHRIFKSERMNNAGPYARLKAAMDYWCALWFWPIDKADLLPTRQEFFLDMDLILEGGIQNVSVGNNGQMSLFDDNGNVNYDTEGNLQFAIEGTQLANDFSSQFIGLGEVNLDHLRSQEFNPLSWERLAIANQIAEEQRFHHWELEFADVFADRGGFDLMIGNPPWIKIVWEEKGVLADKNPMFAVRDLDSKKIAEHREDALNDEKTRRLYFAEYSFMSGEQNFLNSCQNYYELKGQQTNLYKCFLPLSWKTSAKDGVCAFVHPNGVFDDPKGALLREQIYKRLSKHFRFLNKENLFTEVSTSREYSLNVYCNGGREKFDVIANLVNVEAIDDCYDEKCLYNLQGLYDENGRWSHTGHPNRIISIGEKELRIFANLLDGSEKDWKGARLLVIHAKTLLEVLKLMSNCDMTLSMLRNDIFVSELWHETNAQKDGTIEKDVHFPADCLDAVLSGAHIGVGNPTFKGSRRNCSSRYDFDPIDLTTVGEEFIQRCNFKPACCINEYILRSPETSWGEKYINCYKIVSRRMLNQSGERTLMTAILPPKVGHINTVFGMTLKKDISFLAGLMASIPYDFYVKSTGKSDARFDTLQGLPYVIKTRIKEEIQIRALVLNCITANYSELWRNEFPNISLQWTKSDKCLNTYVNENTVEWNVYCTLRNDYERRQALIEIDVLVAMLLGMTLEQLIDVYHIQFPVLQKIEEDTWYDSNGRIVFTCSTNLPGVGFARDVWENEVVNNSSSYRKIIDDNCEDGPVERTIKYVAPYKTSSRESDYKIAWVDFEKRFRL